MNRDRTFDMRSRAPRVCVALCVLSLAVGLDKDGAMGETYPLPRSKPPVPLRENPVYPLPRSKPPVPANTAAPGADSGQVDTPLWKQVLNRVRPRSKPGARSADSESTDRPLTTSAAWSDAQIAAAREACRARLKGLAISYSEAKPVGGPQGCGIAAPIKVTAVGGPQRIAIRPAAVINCKLAAATVKWAETIVQNGAMSEFGEPVVKLRNAAAYVCRRRNNKPDGKLSEHALGNAIDISSFTLASGKTITVLEGWRARQARAADTDTGSPGPAPETAASRFLKKTHKGACTVFSTILGPEADAYHANHFHLDLGRGGRYLVCR